MSTEGILGKFLDSLLSMLDDLQFDKTTSNIIIRKPLNIGSLFLCVLLFQNFVDVDLFLAARKIEESLRMKKPDLCLAWCHDNKTKLRKMKVCDFRCIYIFHICISLIN